jgi:mono/diheme cytochrome c family protein
MKFGKWLIGIAIVGVLLFLLIKPKIDPLLKIVKTLKAPPYESVDIVWTDQNWNKDEWEWWYHVSQGSALESIIPYDWFLALEQPKLFGTAGDFIAQDYLGRFGFLPDGSDYYSESNSDGSSYYGGASNSGGSAYQGSKYNPDGLPVGFTKTEGYFDPKTGQTTTALGFTCAACHTAQLNYNGKGIRIEGGPNMIDVNKFKTATGIALLLTDKLPWRFNRFADRVLGKDHSAEQKTDLKKQLDALIDQAAEVQAKTAEFYPLEEGFSRLDALDRIGNFVFGVQIDFNNFHAVDAPVNYPHLWSAPWFNWVQYNGSVMQPMTRNAGEAMGVFARVNFDPNNPNYDLYDSNVNVTNLHKIEELLTGDSIFTGLAAPKWPEEILGPIDSEKAAQGKKLYEAKCQQCHLPPMDSPEFLDDKYWVALNPDYPDRKYLKVRMKNLYDIGTDPTAAVNWVQRVVNLKDLPKDYQPTGDCESQERFVYDGMVTAGFALPFTVDKTVQYQYDKLGLTPEQREAFNGYRPDLARAPLAYKARPLNGIWATAPFLHNGSVPNLYEMFLPVEKRSKEFYLGPRDFDPKYVGYETAEISGGFLLDTTQKANANTGHEFKGDGTGPGVVGAELTEEERWALVEYLKTL